MDCRALSRASAVGSSVMGTPSICDQLASSLDTKQIQFCKKHPGFMTSVQTGATRAIDECKFQFRTRRWNCSTLDDDDDDDDTHQPTIVSLPPSPLGGAPVALPKNANNNNNNKKKKKKKKMMMMKKKDKSQSQGMAPRSKCCHLSAPHVNLSISPCFSLPESPRSDWVGREGALMQMSLRLLMSP